MPRNAYFENNADYKAKPCPEHLERVRRFLAEVCTENQTVTVKFADLFYAWNRWQDKTFPISPTIKFANQFLSRVRFSICVQSLGYPSVRDRQGDKSFGGLVCPVKIVPPPHSIISPLSPPRPEPPNA